MYRRIDVPNPEMHQRDDWDDSFMAKPEVAFASYSQLNNRDRYLRDFIQELRLEVSERGKFPIEEVLFFDSDGVTTGEDWVERLSAAVSTCKVLVAICSPHFVSSQFCGKEVEVFLQRLQKWKLNPANKGKPVQAIITVLWIKTELPSVLAHFQFKEGNFPREYVDNDLRTLCKLNRFADHRNEVIDVLAHRIIEAARGDLPPFEAIPHFDNIASAFDSRPIGSRYGIAVVDLMKDGNSAARSDGSSWLVETLLADVCGSLTPWRMLQLDKHIPESIRDAQKNREAILILADLPTLTAPLIQKTLRLIDSAGGDQTALVIAGSADWATVEAGRRLTITLKGLFPASFGNFWERAVDLTGKVGLRETLSESLAKLRERLVREDDSLPATDPALVAAATENGISLEQQPILTGPEGSR